MQKQKLQQKLGLNLSPQQIQFLSLLQIPLSRINSRIQEELEKNPALEEEESTDNISIDELNEDNPNSYKFRQNNNPDFTEVQISNSFESLQEHLKKQILILNLKEEDQFLAEYIIDSLDENGWLTRDLFSISDDLLINLDLEFSENEIIESLKVIQQLEPFGVGARNLQECLIIQLNSKEQNEIVETSKVVLQNEYENFSKKNFETIEKNLEISEEELRKVYKMVEKLNPFPASNFTFLHNTAFIIPDFTIQMQNEKNVVVINKRFGRELRVSHYYQKMIEQTTDREAKKFLKQKIESANWFKDAIKQRENTLKKVMETIVVLQDEYFKSGDQKTLKPMKLADIAEIVKMDISTISRVTNSKYAETFFGTFLLKDLFSEAYRKDNGEMISTKVIKQKLKEIIDLENKSNPYTDDKLCNLLGEDEYHIARRTVTKYREELKITTSKYRREL